MPNLNMVQIIGHLGSNPEIRQTTTGKTVGNFSVATSVKFTDHYGQPKEETEWHRIVVWDKLAELAGKYLAKGSAVYVQGRLQTRSWDDKDGVKKYTTEIIAQQMQFLTPKKDAGEEHKQNLGTENTPGIDDIPF